MARAHLRETINDTTTGQPIANAAVTIREQGTTTAIAATMYAAKTGGTTVSNPITTDAGGTVELWLDTPQQVDFRVVAAGYSDVTISDLPVLIDQTEIVSATRSQTLTNKTLTSPTINSPEINTPTINGQMLLDVGSASAPTLSWDGDSNSGRYWVGADEYSDVVGGAATPGGIAIHYRKGSKFPQVGMGQIFDVGSSPYWAWTTNDVVLKIHHVMTGAADGDIIGAHFEVSTVASSGGAGVTPDSSATTAVIYKQGTANAAVRAIEGQTIVSATVSDAHAFATSYATELGIHMAIAGNGQWKTGLINGISTAAGIPGSPAGQRADVGLLLRGEAGYVWPIRFWDEVTTGKFPFNVQQDGRVLGSWLGTAAAPAYSFYTASDAEDATGMYLATTNTLGFSTGGAARMVIGSTGNVTLNYGLIGTITNATQITSNQNDYNPTSLATSFIMHISSDAARDITGLAAPSGSVPKVIVLSNAGGNNITLKHESASSTDVNRFNLPGGVDAVMNTHDAVWLYYSGNRWRVMALAI